MPAKNPPAPPENIQPVMTPSVEKGAEQNAGGPVEPAVSNEVTPFGDVFSSEVIAKLIESGVKQELERLGINKNQKVIEGQHNLGPRDLPAPDFKYLKHYRNTVSPFMRIQELDMSSEVPQLAPRVGRWIIFRNGHFYATTENQVAQLDWMMKTAEHSADTTNTLGGNRAIFVDDGEKIFYCTAGCDRADFHTASEANFKAHMRSVHGVNFD